MSPASISPCPTLCPAGEDKFRRVRLTNPAIQQRVAAWTGAVDFLQVAGRACCWCCRSSDLQGCRGVAGELHATVCLSKH